MSIEHQFEQLIEILEEMNRVYEGMLKLSVKKKDIIVQGKVSELEKIVKTEQTLVIEAGKLENKREEIITEISKEIGINTAEVTIKQLEKRSGKRHAKNLKECRNKLVKTLDELKSQNELNSNLIKNSLDYIDFSLNLFSNINSDSGSYVKNGEIGKPEKKNLFDVKL